MSARVFSCAHVHTFMWVWGDLNLGSHACVAHTDPFPSSHDFLYRRDASV